MEFQKYFISFEHTMEITSCGGCKGKKSDGTTICHIIRLLYNKNLVYILFLV